MNDLKQEGKSANPQHRVSHSPNYWLVFFALALLTLLEVGVTYIDVPQAPILLSLAFMKAALVAAYFMHLRFDSRWYTFLFLAPYLLIVPFLIVALM